MLRTNFLIEAVEFHEIKPEWFSRMYNSVFVTIPLLAVCGEPCRKERFIVFVTCVVLCRFLGPLRPPRPDKNIGAAGSCTGYRRLLEW